MFMQDLIKSCDPLLPRFPYFGVWRAEQSPERVIVIVLALE